MILSFRDNWLREFFVNDVSIGVDDDGTDGWSATWDLTGVTDGPYTIKATATDMDTPTPSQTDSASIVVTVIGGQGHVFGRGNQQISAAVIRAVGLNSIVIVAAKSKISALEGRPLLVDTNDSVLDQSLCGYRSIITGYDDQILYRIAAME